MKLLSVSALLCAVMALTTAANGTAGIKTEDRHGVRRSAACPCGWIEFSGKCYIYEPKSMTFAEAQKSCQSMGANLASVHSDAEYKHLQNVVFQATNTNRQAWIGGSDSLQEGLWYWSDGTPFDYVNWCPGQPDDNQGKQDCIWMNFYPGCLGWDDIQCDAQIPSICTKKTF